MAKHQRTTAEERAWVVGEWDSSGLSAAAFAGMMGVAVCTLYGWRREVRAAAVAQSESSPANAAAASRPRLTNVALAPATPLVSGTTPTSAPASIPTPVPDSPPPILPHAGPNTGSHVASASTSTSASASATFAEVILRPGGDPSHPESAVGMVSQIEIMIHDVVVRVGAEFDDHQLRRVLSVLRSTG